MAIKLKKEDFDKHNVNGFKIGDRVLIPSLNLSSEIIAIDKNPASSYNVMIDEVGVGDFSVPDLGSSTLSSLIADYPMIYYRKKALKNKYNAWARSTDLEHIPTEDKDWQEIESTKSEENEDCLHGEDDMEEDNAIEEAGEEDDKKIDSFLVDDILSTSLHEVEEFSLKLTSTEVETSDWTSSDMDLIEVYPTEATHIAFVFDNGCFGRFLEFMYNNIKDNDVLEEVLILTIDDAIKEQSVEPILNYLYLEAIIVSYNVGRARSAVLMRV